MVRTLSLLALSALGLVAAAPPKGNLEKRSGFGDGQPISDSGKGAPLLGMSGPGHHARATRREWRGMGVEDS